MSRPFRFGITTSDAGSRAEWTDRARRVEDLGFSTLTVPDHLRASLAPMPALVSAAAATTRLRVGTNVLNNDLRHPVLVAREAATIDLLTDGRLELGLGAGYARVEYDQAGLDYSAGGVRVERLAEAVTIVSRLLEGGPVTFAGRYYRVTEHAVHPRPVQRPRPPLMIGGNGPRLLALAAAAADIVSLSGITFRRGGSEPDLSAWKAGGVDERMRTLRAEAGDRWPQLELGALVQRVIVTDDRRAAAEELARRWPQLTVDDLLQAPFVLLGTVDQIAEDLIVRRERWGLSYHVVFEAALEVVAPVVARLAGR